jgi:magnesium transporter
MIVDSALYRDGRRHPVDLSDVAETWREVEDTDAFLWVGMHEPGDDELQKVADALSLHPLAVEDALSPHQRPKVEPYDDMLFIVLRTLWYVDERDEVETGQVAMFVSRNYVVTVRQGSGVELSGVRTDLEQKAHLLGHGPSAVVYSVADRIVDGYEDVAGELDTDVGEVEESVFSPDRTRDSHRIYVLKREIAEFRRAVTPLRTPMQRFANAGYPFIHSDAAAFFRDIADHVVRVNETIETLDQLLTTAFEAHLARISVDQNEDMRKISAWAAIAAVGTLVAGVYGMNFQYMPELKWHLGYPLAIGLMVVLSLVLYRQFKKSGWL